MDFIIGILIIIGIIISFKYVRAFFKRLVFMFKLKKLCAENSYKLYTNSFLWLLGKTPHNGCDFYVETEKQVYSVKFLFIPYKSRGITFIGSSEYFWGAPGIKRTYKLPTVDYLYKMRDDFARKPVMPYLLLSPASFHIYYIPHLGASLKEVKRIGDLYFIDYFTIISQHRLLEMLEKEKQS